MENQLGLNLPVKYPDKPLEDNVYEEWLDWNYQNSKHELALIRRQK